ncbi:MAG: 2,3-bisphosphoglycerate-independent phosphoglycerate mutase [Pseudomonadota bacterium]
MQHPIPKPIVLLILDGFGHRQEKQYNAIATAKTPHIDRLWQDCPHTLISGSSCDVGLPKGQMGNSEVGHLNLGAGRVVPQDFTRIEQAIESGEFYHNDTLISSMKKTIAADNAVHVIGLLSPGGVHSHEQQIHAAVNLAAQQGVKKLYLHLFLDGRDTPPRSAMASIEKLEQVCQQCQTGQIVSLIGRYYAMDRDQRWDRIEQAYNLMTLGQAHRHADTAAAGLQAAYDDGENDEFVKATAIHPQHASPVVVEDGDVIIFMNYRADRARQLTRAFTDVDFSGFKRQAVPKLTQFVTLTQYEADFNVAVVFPPLSMTNVLGEYLSKQGLTQLRIAETEKYAHVTFFFNGGVEQAFPGEDRLLIPSPKVATYDLQPEMSAPELTDKLVEDIKARRHDCVICNYANADMVGHTGNMEAAVKAIECLDTCIGRIAEALTEVGGELLITADHGNAEKMYNEQTKQAHTAHTAEPVPFIFQGRAAEIVNANGASLRDIAPTLLYLLGLSQPDEMTGNVLLNLKN